MHEYNQSQISYWQCANKNRNSRKHIDIFQEHDSKELYTIREIECQFRIRITVENIRTDEAETLCKQMKITIAT